MEYEHTIFSLQLYNFSLYFSYGGKSQQNPGLPFIYVFPSKRRKSVSWVGLTMGSLTFEVIVYLIHGTLLITSEHDLLSSLLNW